MAPSTPSPDVEDGEREIASGDLGVEAADDGTLVVHFGGRSYAGLVDVEDLGDRGDTYDCDPVAGGTVSLESVGVNGGQWNNWEGAYKQAAQWDTSLGNPRLDLVNFGFNHPLMPLLDTRDIRMQIKLQKRVHEQTWGPNVPFSKGIFPPETAFSDRIIPALAAEGIDVEVIDLRSVRPIDRATVIASVKKTTRLLCVYEGVKTLGVGAEISAMIAESDAFDYLDAPIVRLGGSETPIPYNPELEKAAVPQVPDIFNAARDLVRGVR